MNARGTIGIGLTRKRHQIDEIPGFHGGIRYSNTVPSGGLLYVRMKSEKVGSRKLVTSLSVELNFRGRK